MKTKASFFKKRIVPALIGFPQPMKTKASFFKKRIVPATVVLLLATGKLDIGSSSCEIIALRLETSAVLYCLANYRSKSKVVPETEGKNFVEMHKTYSKKFLSEKLAYLRVQERSLEAHLQAKERYREEIELLKQKTLSMSSVSSSGKLDSTSL